MKAEAGYIRTNDAAAALVGLSVRRFQEQKHLPGFPAKGPKGWKREDLIAWGATRSGRLSNLGPEGAAVQAEIFEVRAQLLEIREQAISGKLIPTREAERILFRVSPRLSFQVKNAFETYSSTFCSIPALEAAEKAYGRFCELMQKRIGAEVEKIEGGEK